MNIENVPVSKIKEYGKNAKKHPTEQIEKIKKSIQEFGFNVPLIIDKNNIIIAGHGRYLASLQLGLEALPCVRKEDLSEEQVKAYRIADNKVSESEWDLDVLKLELEGMDLFSGFDKQEVFDFFPEEESKDTEPEPVEEIQTSIKEGDIFELGEHRLMCGDSSKQEDVIALMGGEQADLLLTDPPYGIDIVKNNGKIEFGDGKLGFKKKSTETIFGSIGASGIVPVGIYPKIKGDDTPFNPENLLEIGKNQIIWGGNYFANKLPTSSCWLIWDKREEIPSNNFADCEIAWTSFNKPARIYRHKWSGLIRSGNRKDELNKRVHPTQKPVGLHIQLLKDYSDEDSKIVDLYGGSGTTLIACENLKRKCFMMEIDPQYCQVIINRWEKHTGKKAIKK